MGGIAKIFGGGGKPAPERSAPAVESPRSDRGTDTRAQTEADNARKAGNRRKRVQSQANVGKAGSASGLRTQLSSPQTRSGISTQ